MEHLGFLLFLFIMSLSYIISRAVVFYNKDFEKNKRRFWERESIANATRKADISGLDYVKPDLDSLPLDSLLATARPNLSNTLEDLAKERIIDLSSYTNTDLKEMFGPANLDSLSRYDTNFTTLIRSLNEAGKLLYDIGDDKSARLFLEYAVSIGSDISTTFTMLAEDYARCNDNKKLDSLIKSAKKLSSLSAASTVNKLKKIRQEHSS